MSVSNLSSSNMQYLMQQTDNIAQRVKQTLKGQTEAAQNSFASALNSSSSSPATPAPATAASASNQLSGVSMASLLQGSSANAGANMASQTASSLLNMLV
jgi:hypothetical protein